MNLSEYIVAVLKPFKSGCEVEFTVNLTDTGMVSDTPTGNTITFTIIKGEE